MIRFTLAQTGYQKFCGLCGVQGMECSAQLPDALEFLIVKHEFLVTRTGASDVDSREDALVGQFTGKSQIHVPRRFELFVDHIIHAAACFDEYRGDNGETAAVLDVPRRTKQSLGPV